MIQKFNFLALPLMCLGCQAENSKSLKENSSLLFYGLFYLCMIFVVMLYYSRLSRRLKLNNTETLAHALWQKKCEVSKDEILKKVFKLELEDKSIESLDSSFSSHIRELINKHRLEKSADISALKRYLEMTLS